VTFLIDKANSDGVHCYRKEVMKISIGIIFLMNWYILEFCWIDFVVVAVESLTNVTGGGEGFSSLMVWVSNPYIECRFLTLVRVFR